ncbi:hypothetical protein [Roseobacter sp. A03A-229]
MRLILILLAAILSACERYTDATSPCFGRDDAPAMSRANTEVLSFAAQGTKDCDFEAIGRSP